MAKTFLLNSSGTTPTTYTGFVGTGTYTASTSTPQTTRVSSAGTKPILVKSLALYINGNGANRSVIAKVGGATSNAFGVVSATSATSVYTPTISAFFSDSTASTTTTFGFTTNGSTFFGRNGGTAPGVSFMWGRVTYVEAPQQPTLSVTAGTGSITLTISGAQDFGSSDVAGSKGYYYEYSTSSTFASDVTYGTFPNQASHTITGLTAGTLYYARVSAINEIYFEAGGQRSVVSTTGSATPTAASTTYTATYYGNGNTGGSTTATSYTNPPSTSGTVASNGFTRTGYTFSSWNTSSNGTGTAYSEGSSFTGSINLYAQWTALSYAITYSANGGTGTMSNTTWSYPNSGTVSSNSFTRSGYTFNGWKDAGGTSVAVGATYSTSSVDLYAQWLISTITPAFTDTVVSSPATLNVAYTDGVLATNATSYSIASGALPAGLSLNTSTGAITGTPTSQGTSTFAIRATSSTSTSVDTSTLTINVYPPGKRPSTNTRITTAKRFIGIGASTTNAQGVTIAADANGYVNLSRMMVYKAGQWTPITNI